MDEVRRALKEEIVAANRAPFDGWWAEVLDLDPGLLRRIHLFVQSAEQSGPVPETLRHLIWVAADSVVTHLYPRGLGVHIALAMHCGATLTQVMETLAITSSVCSRGYGAGLGILVDELQAAGLEGLQEADVTGVQTVRQQLQEEASLWPKWMETELRTDPYALKAFLGLGESFGSDDGLDERWRRLITIGVASCPAIADAELTRLSIRRALDAGIEATEIRQTLRLANTITLHSIAEGVMQIKERGLAAHDC